MYVLQCMAEYGKYESFISCMKTYTVTLVSLGKWEICWLITGYLCIACTGILDKGYKIVYMAVLAKIMLVWGISILIYTPLVLEQRHYRHIFFVLETRSVIVQHCAFTFVHMKYALHTLNSIFVHYIRPR